MAGFLVNRGSALEAAYLESVRKSTIRISAVKQRSQVLPDSSATYGGYNAELGKHFLTNGGDTIYADYRGDALIRKGEVVSLLRSGSTSANTIQKIGN